MRIRSIFTSEVPPVRKFEIEDLDDVVIIAGRNGVGKTRLLQAIMNAFRSPGKGAVRLVIEATSSDEAAAWKKGQLDTSDATDAALLRQTLHAKRRRRNWTGGVFQIESDRTIEKIQPFTFSWDAPDPFEEEIGWEQTLQGFTSRFQDTVHSIFRKVHQLQAQLGSTAFRLGREGKTQMSLGFTDPVEPFKQAFHQLLAPKELLDADPRDQRLQYRIDGKTFDVSQTLSSGEREVVNIVFDILLRRPSDCIVFIDEPELHLHPELSYKLLNTLRTIGARNQFFLSTHSPDIITAALDQSVVFLAPAREDGSNQAVRVSEEDETHEALRALGHSIGIVALGRKIVLIEGTETSLDKQAYGAIIRDRFPSLVLAPSEGRDIIASFSAFNSRVLQKSIWGVDFFMLCDRDAVPIHRDAAALETEAEGRVRVLRRYHLENYFLDEECIARVFESLEPEDNWLRNPQKIREELMALARSSISYATAVHASARIRDIVGNVNAMPGACHGVSLDELIAKFRVVAAGEGTRVAEALDVDAAADLTATTWNQLENSLTGGEWIALFPGRPLLRQFAAKTQLGYGRLKTGYLQASRGLEDKPFADIVEIFDGFQKHGAV